MWEELTRGSKWEGLISCQSGYLFEAVCGRSLPEAVRRWEDLISCPLA